MYRTDLFSDLQVETGRHKYTNHGDLVSLLSSL